MKESRVYRAGMLAGLASVAAGGFLLVAALPSSATPGQESGSATSSTVVPDNPTCGELGDFAAEFKIENPVEDTYSDEESDFEVAITDITDGNPMTFSFESNIAVSAVFVKAGNGGILYTFEPPSTVGTDLASPKDSISHISFCWNPDQATTTTTDKDTTTTTTRPDDTTTTTEKGETTTTTEGRDTTTVPGEGPTTSVAGGGGGTAPTTTPSGELPRTGSDITKPLLIAGALLLILGTTVLATTRRLRQA